LGQVKGAAPGYSARPAARARSSKIEKAYSSVIALTSVIFGRTNWLNRRVERIACKVLGGNAGIMTDALSLAGTFHGIGSTAA
jgi:DNA helicase II / ATP-dependent DNA helicase PcrA